MGVSLNASLNVLIPADKRASALAAINKHGSFRWDNSLKPFNTLEEAFEEWSFYSEGPEGQDFVIDTFEGEKYYSEIEELFRVVAPFVEAGSWAELVIEYDNFEKYYFDGHCLMVLQGSIVYENPLDHDHR